MSAVDYRTTPVTTYTYADLEKEYLALDKLFWDEFDTDDDRGDEILNILGLKRSCDRSVPYCFTENMMILTLRYIRQARSGGNPHLDTWGMFHDPFYVWSLYYQYRNAAEQYRGEKMAHGFSDEDIRQLDEDIELVLDWFAENAVEGFEPEAEEDESDFFDDEDDFVGQPSEPPVIDERIGFFIPRWKLSGTEKEQRQVRLSISERRRIEDTYFIPEIRTAAV
ncbi:hypothetical protein SAMN02910447_00053 [Ruminococcus sp. YE71]|uniref:hypothetical protein n=1 Tax=unclassified Ruminococcus TaxID=2608920 RepID=UPI00087F76BA|nr:MULTISPECIES: hypothetical protein [unclassified Ruminococcus]SDA10261.1 hypothetical protein SAMN02910446_00296 [Ruminococcus sp. YE78]SFW10897.1 hypothetical protein SAMN02910447_00053 [Ruminococcus sp. YE71]